MKASSKKRLKKLEEALKEKSDLLDPAIIYDPQAPLPELSQMDADSYKRLKSHTTEQIDRLTIQMNDLEIADTALEKYARYGMSLLKDLTWYFQEAEPQAR